MPLAVEIIRQRQRQRKSPAATGASAGAETRLPVGLTLDPVHVRAQILAQHRKSLSKRLHKMAFERGQLLFDGRWRCSQEVRRAYRRMWLRSLMHVGESLLLMALLVGTAGFIGLMLALLAGLSFNGH